MVPKGRSGWTPGPVGVVLRHRGGRIYYDDNGYFFNETNAVSEVLTFRVGLELYSFAQFGSYLFRPDLLEKRWACLNTQCSR